MRKHVHFTSKGIFIGPNEQFSLIFSFNFLQKWRTALLHAVELFMFYWCRNFNKKKIIKFYSKFDVTHDSPGHTIQFYPGFIQFLFFWLGADDMLTFVRRSCRLPLYQVMMAFGREPTLSHAISYRRSATNCDGGSMMFTVRGFTEKFWQNENRK